ncbi:HAD family hydrolase [Candidatus Woesearchaeota archaeon]|nr:HAD family hydrolase [Candidatus Woesearchaeota archaeon]
MGGLQLTESFGEIRNLTKIIVDILLACQPLTAKQIYFKLGRDGISITYQAIHKKLLLMLREQILKKNGLEYSINQVWLDKIEEFSTSVRERLRKRNRLLVTQLNKKNFSANQKLIKVISFDLGGALFNNQFDELLWRREIPKAYAEQYGLSREKAFEEVTSEYSRLWGKVTGWRNPEFWLKHFSLNKNFKNIIKGIKGEIFAYLDVEPILKKLSKEYHLVIISHAEENIMKTKIKLAGFDKYFTRIFSTGSNFNKMTKDADIYREICEMLKIQPEEMVHVGNDLTIDYKIPTSIGINAFLIDRIGHSKEHFVVRDLYRFEEKLKEMEKEFI